MQELLSNLEAELRPVSRQPVPGVAPEPAKHTATEQPQAETASTAQQSLAPAPEAENGDDVSHEARPAAGTEDSEASESAAAASESPADDGAAEPGSTEPDPAATSQAAEAKAEEVAEAQKGTGTEKAAYVSAERASYKGTIRLDAAHRTHLAASSCLIST